MNKENINRIKFITLTAVFTALVFVFTAFVNLRLPIGQGGLIHLGNVPLFICAILLGRKSGAIAGGVGMALFDLVSGWTLWAPFTFVIVGTMGYVVGKIAENRKSISRYTAALIAALLIKVAGYYIAEWIIYKDAVAPLLSIPGNVIQVGTAAAMVLFTIKPIEISLHKAGIRYV